MQRNRLFIILLTFIFTAMFLFSCAGSKKEEQQPASEEAAQQQDLDDIESLLGITSDQTTQQSQPKRQTQPKRQKQNGEKLDLLDTSERPVQSNNSMASAAVAQQNQNKDKNSAKYKKEIQTLKSKLKQKEQEINSLEQQLTRQNAEIQELSIQPKTRSFSAPTGSISAEEYKNKYDEARAAFESRNYRTAIDYFEALLASNSSHPLADNAQYWIGESHYALRQYDAAIIDFEKVLTFPRSNKKADAQFKLGLCYIRKGDTAKAAEEFDRLKADYPKSRYVARAEKIMANL